MSSTRREFGFSRTECSCEKCVSFCKKPSWLVPTDIDRIWQKVASQLKRTEFIKAYLTTGKGAVLMNTDCDFTQYQTIIPQSVNGACIFLKDKKCTIHEVSPYGCAFFDDHIGRLEGDHRVHEGLEAIKKDWVADGLYSLVLQFVLGVAKGDIIKNVTKMLFPNGVPRRYRDLADHLRGVQLKRSAGINPRKS